MLGPTARAEVLQLDDISRSTILDGQEAFVGIGFVVGTAHRLEVLWTHSGASLECERGQAALHRRDKHVLTAILFTHMAFASIKFIVRSTNKRRHFRIAISIAVGSGCTIFQRNRNYTAATRFLFHLAQCAIHIAIGCTNWSGRNIGWGAFLVALEYVGFELCACTDVRQVHIAAVGEKKRASAIK